MSATAHADAPPAEGKRRLGKPALIAVLLLVVSAGMAAAFLWLLPGGEGHGEEAAHGHEAGHGAEGEGPDSVEVLIDTFSTTNSRAAPGTVVHVTFKLTGVVPAGQEVAFEHAANQHHNTRVRQAVEKVARSASLDDLTDPNLTTVKRQLREEINKVLRKSYLTEVVISDFKTIEH
ncbi:MAG TPA: flagellar basal body-associated FliL family protein [Planctomycetaceae bacterium]